MVANSCMDMGDSIRVSQMEFESSALDLRDANRIVLLAILTQEVHRHVGKIVPLFFFFGFHDSIPIPTVGLAENGLFRTMGQLASWLAEVYEAATWCGGFSTP